MPADLATLPLDATQEMATRGGSIAPPPKAFFDRDPELMYCLDCALELGEISPLEHLVFNYETDAAQSLYHRRQTRPDDWSAHWLRNTARSYLDQLSLPERYVIALRGIPGLDLGIKALSERMEFLVESKAQVDLGLKQDLSRLFQDHEPELAKSVPRKVFCTPADVTRTNVHAFINPLFSEMVTRLEEDIRLTKDALVWLAEPGNKGVAREIAARLLRVPVEPPPGVQVAHLVDTGKAISANRKKLRSAKGAIKKAIKLLTRFGADENARLLVSGEKVVISHPDSAFQFRLQAHKGQGWLVQRTVTPGAHVPYQLTLETKKGKSLAQLCVLFDKTPVLDQLLALTMYVQTGNEQELLDKANWYGIVDIDEVCEHLQAHAPDLIAKVRRPIGDRISKSIAIEHPEIEFWRPYVGPVRSWVGEAFQPAREMLERIQLSLANGDAGRALA